MKRFCDKKRQGFTLVELVVVIVMMAILATVGAIGIGGMVREYSAQMCHAARQEAAQQFISDWLEGDIAFSGGNVSKWFENYKTIHDEKDIDKWSISAGAVWGKVDTYSVTITCSAHKDAAQKITMEFYSPSYVAAP